MRGGDLLITFLLLCFLTSIVFYICYNYVAPVFGLPELGYLQSLAFVFGVKTLLK